MEKKIVIMFGIIAVLIIGIVASYMFMKSADLSISLFSDGASKKDLNKPLLPNLVSNCEFFYSQCNIPETLSGSMQYFLQTMKDDELLTETETYQGQLTSIYRIMTDIGNNLDISPIILYRMYTVHRQLNPGKTPVGFVTFADYFTSTAREIKNLVNTNNLTPTDNRSSEEFTGDSVTLFYNLNPNASLASSVLVEYLINKYGYREDIINNLAISINSYNADALRDYNLRDPKLNRIFAEFKKEDVSLYNK